MSLSLPVSGALAPTAQPRDPAVVQNVAATRLAPAVTPTLTQAAVQQAKATTRSDLLTQGDIVPVAERRSRLVGPPPTFEVNLLQHMRETRYDPPEHGAVPEDDAADTSADRQSAMPAAAATGLYRQLDQTPADTLSETFDTRF